MADESKKVSNKIKEFAQDMYDKIIKKKARLSILLKSNLPSDKVASTKAMAIITERIAVAKVVSI